MEKKLLVIYFCFISLLVRAQDTIYYDNQSMSQSTSENCNYYNIIYKDSSDTNRVYVKRYDCSGYLKCDFRYSNYKKGILDGESNTWYENGQLRLKANYQEGKYDGKFLTFYENGIPRREDNYEKGKLISGKCYGVDGRDTTYFDFEIMPQFPGGEDALLGFIKKEIVYPKKARKKGITGRVYVQFIVDKYGDVTNVKVLRGIDPLLDEEAIRAVSAMPRWKPGLQDGVAVNVTYNLPVNFTLR